MPKRVRKLACDQFLGELAELIGSGADLHDHPHVKGCARCRQIVEELEVIAKAAERMVSASSEWSELKWWPR